MAKAPKKTTFNMPTPQMVKAMQSLGIEVPIAKGLATKKGALKKSGKK